MKPKLKRLILYYLGNFVLHLFSLSFPPLPTTSAIIPNKEKILAIKISNSGGYALPGGMLKGKESFEKGLEREVLEETGLKIYDLKLFGQYACKVEYPTINLTYIAKVKKGKLTHSSEGQPTWLKPQEIIDKLIYLDNRLALNDYLKK